MENLILEAEAKHVPKLMDVTMRAVSEALKPKVKPFDQYVGDEKFECPACQSIKENRVGDLILCDVRICDDCVTTDLERIAELVEANYDDVCGRLRQVRAALEA